MPLSHAVDRYVADLESASGLWIAGAWVSALRTFEVEDPGTGEVVAEVSDGTCDDATAAVDAASHALPAWRNMPPRRRSEILYATFDLMRAESERLSELVMLENGKPESDARAEIGYAAEFFRWYAEEAVRPSGSYGEAPGGGSRNFVTHHPVGVAALVTPWNFPAAMATRKIGPALAAGCTAVFKPAAETPLTALAIARLLAQAGLPDGVLNVVPTTDAAGVVEAWLGDERVRKISFTGSTPVGRRLLAEASGRVVNSSMELGGNAPFVVMEDADVDVAVRGALAAKFRNGGQACTAANRFYVHDDVVEAFTDSFGSAVGELCVAHASNPEAQIGPVISARAATRIEQTVSAAVDSGARITHEAQLPCNSDGHFVAPRVLRDVPPEANLVTEEIFGPIAPILNFSSDDEVLGLANASEYGLAAYVFSGDLRRALSLAEGLDAGMVGINRGVVSDPSAPFGGVKQSGLGREGAREGMLAFTETQYFAVDW